MDRGFKANLSPNEEVTLRRVSYGIASLEELRSQDLLRLVKLQLVTRLGGRLVLTKLGADRLAQLRGIEPAASQNDWATRLIEKLR